MGWEGLVPLGPNPLASSSRCKGDGTGTEPVGNGFWPYSDLLVGIACSSGRKADACGVKVASGKARARELGSGFSRV